jgi:hypothetical protein
MMGGAKAHYDGIVAFSQTDFTEDLKKIIVPVLVMHSEDHQIVARRQTCLHLKLATLPNAVCLFLGKAKEAGRMRKSFRHAD